MNVRELENGLEAALALASNGPIDMQHLPPAVTRREVRVLAAPLPGSCGFGNALQSLLQLGDFASQCDESAACAGQVSGLRELLDTARGVSGPPTTDASG